MSNMYAVIYQFDVIQGQEEDFETLWQMVTESFIEHAGGLGSRLHKNEAGSYMAYAQWPVKKLGKLPDKNYQKLL